MRTKIRLVAVVGVVAVAAFALASLPALSQDDVARNSPKLNEHASRGEGILTLDRNYDDNHATPQPGVPPDKDAKPGRTAGVANNPSNPADTTGAFGASVIGGVGASSSRSERVERSLKTTADRLR